MAMVCSRLAVCWQIELKKQDTNQLEIMAGVLAPGASRNSTELPDQDDQIADEPTGPDGYNSDQTECVVGDENQSPP